MPPWLSSARPMPSTRSSPAGLLLTMLCFPVSRQFATRLHNVFVIGEGNRPMVSLPKRKGIKMSILEERAVRPPKM